MPYGIHNGFLRGNKRYNWKQDTASHSAYHHWLKCNFGKAYKCENPNCPKKPTKRYEWSLLKGKNYNHLRENYWMLCVSCHRIYDGIANWHF